MSTPAPRRRTAGRPPPAYREGARLWVHSSSTCGCSSQRLGRGDDGDSTPRCSLYSRSTSDSVSAGKMCVGSEVAAGSSSAAASVLMVGAYRSTSNACASRNTAVSGLRDCPERAEGSSETPLTSSGLNKCCRRASLSDRVMSGFCSEQIS